MNNKPIKTVQFRCSCALELNPIRLFFFIVYVDLIILANSTELDIQSLKLKRK